MSWADKRIKQYSEGKKPTWIEKRLLEHAEPVNLTASLISLVLIAYGLWEGSWFWIIIALAVGFFGHLSPWFRK